MLDLIIIQISVTLELRTFESSIILSLSDHCLILFFKVYCQFQWGISTYKEKTEHAFVCNVFFIFLTFPHSDDNIRFLGIIQKAQKNTRISCNMGKCAKNPCVIFLRISLFVSFYTTCNSCANGSLKTQN